MTDTTTRSPAEAFYAGLERAWNAADGAAYAADFAPDADFVDIRGTRHHGAGAVAGGHQAIFGSIYSGSTISYDVVSVRQLAGGVLLVQADAALQVPAGPLGGSSRATSTAVLVEDAGRWRAVLMHNTLVAPPPGR